MSADSYFRESLGLLHRRTGDPAGFLRRHALLLLKPDAVAARALLPAIDWLAGQGLRIVAAAPTRLSRHMVRALWQEQWRNASPYRCWLADLFAPATESLVLVVRAEGRLDEPAAGWLTRRKGPADPGARRPGQLRHVLGRYSFLLNLAHTPDEPGDMVRELGIYFDHRRLGELYDHALTGRDQAAAARELARALHTQVARKDLSFEPAADRLLTALDRVLDGPALPRETRAELRTARSAASGDHPGYRRLLDLLWRHDLVPDVWDVVITGSYLLPMRDQTVHFGQCDADGRPGRAAEPLRAAGRGT